MIFDRLKLVDICQTCQMSGLICELVENQHDITLLVPRRVRWLTRGSEEVKGFCTFKLLQEAHFGFKLLKWVSEHICGYFLHLLRFKVKTNSENSSKSLYFLLSGQFLSILSQFEWIFTTVSLVLR